MARQVDHEGRPVCDACFLSCVATRSCNSGKFCWHFPCSSDLREWARRHRDSPGFVAESICDVRPIDEGKEA